MIDSETAASRLDLSTPLKSSSDITKPLLGTSGEVGQGLSCVCGKGVNLETMKTLYSKILFAVLTLFFVLSTVYSGVAKGPSVHLNSSVVGDQRKTMFPWHGPSEPPCPWDPCDPAYRQQMKATAAAAVAAGEKMIPGCDCVW